jgi:hypothetical protein
LESRTRTCQDDGMMRVIAGQPVRHRRTAQYRRGYAYGELLGCGATPASCPLIYYLLV